MDMYHINLHLTENIYLSDQNNMEKTRHANQADIINPLFEQASILIVWAGGIGSTTAMCLAQCWFNKITVVDYDEVENHNLASQLYKEADIGLSKVHALADNIKEFTGIDIRWYNQKYEPKMLKGIDIVIIGVDNMATRKEVVESLTTKQTRFIDARMAAEAFLVYNYIPVYEKDLYMKTWYGDEEASPETCTNKSVSYNTFAIASILTRFVVGIVKQDPQILNKTQLSVDLHNLIIM